MGVAASQRSVANEPRVPWNERLAVVHRQFPSTVEADWAPRLRVDIELLGRVVRDIIKAEQSPGRRGSRPVLDVEAGEARLRELWGDNYTIAPFTDAFNALIGTRTLADVAARTGLSRTTVHRLARGQMEPTGAEMEAIAKAFRKPPTWFREYRAGYVLAAIADHLERSPETSVALVNHLRGAGK